MEGSGPAVLPSEFCSHVSTPLGCGLRRPRCPSLAALGASRAAPVLPFCAPRAGVGRRRQSARGDTGDTLWAVHLASRPERPILVHAADSPCVLLPLLRASECRVATGHTWVTVSGPPRTIRAARVGAPDLATSLFLLW